MLKPEIVDELCTCGHLISEHGGLGGHGVCQICQCKFFTWNGWVYKEVLALRNGDNVIEELRRTLALKGMEQNVFLVRVEVLKIAEFSVSVEVLYK